MEYKRQVGANVVIVILVLLVIILIAAVGNLVYKSRHQPTAKPPIAQINSKSYTLQYEKLSFKYPSSWKLKDTSLNHSDAVMLSGSNNFTFLIRSGGLGHPSADIPPHILKSEPITLAGQLLYLDYTNRQNDGLVHDIFPSQSQTDALDAPISKNPGGNTGSIGYLSFILSYGDTGKSLTDLPNDTSLKDTKQIIASMHY